MKFAVFYGTVEGHTRKIAGEIGSQLVAAGHSVEIIDISQPGLAGFRDIDAAILAAPIHIGKYPEVFETFVKSWKSELMAIPTAMVSVSLSIASPYEGEREESTHYPDGLESRTGWRADRIHHAAGALKYLEYDFFKRFMMRRIARHEHGPVDTKQDHELTDWDALASFVSDFATEADVIT